MIDFLGHRHGDGAICLRKENVKKVWAAQDPIRIRFVHFQVQLFTIKDLFLTMQQFHHFILFEHKGQPNPATWSYAQVRAYHSLKMAVTSRLVMRPPHKGLSSERALVLLSRRESRKVIPSGICQ
ncbi:hypothetical protein PoB_003193400 [Plakobranchus ocellatus]|uniref:Uncharacterized protein n=1 Tax=Plakobranchus ocellatus TaxID=259542 RepID=A0AAV4AGR0_9GAST|nr:hypothetical protein PoB_003193400 [Plakobranchus ocellatus]